MLLSIQRYDVELTYTPGMEIALADTLLRAPSEEEKPSEVETSFQSVHMAATVPLSDPAMEELRQQTEADPNLQALIEVIKSGWPESK